MKVEKKGYNPNAMYNSQVSPEMKAAYAALNNSTTGNDTAELYKKYLSDSMEEANPIGVSYETVDKIDVNTESLADKTGELSNTIDLENAITKVHNTEKNKNTLKILQSTKTLTEAVRVITLNNEIFPHWSDMILSNIKESIRNSNMLSQATTIISATNLMWSKINC